MTRAHPEVSLDYNWLTPKAEARPAGDKGWGSYATEPIAIGETVAARLLGEPAL